MEQKIKIFGAALDALPSPEKVNLKIAYLNHRSNGSFGEGKFKDPYDFVKSRITKNVVLNSKIEWAGKISIPSWLTPKPRSSDSSKLSIDKFGKFLRSDGCWKYALRIADYIDKEVYQGKYAMIGVDHSLTGGSIMALAKRYSNLNVVILDAHFDVMSREPYYGCGNFLEVLLGKKIVAPKNLWVLGVQDEIARELSRRSFNSKRCSIKQWLERGVNVIFKSEVQSNQFRMVLNGPTYVSIDMDVGSLLSVCSARFMTSYGLSVDEFLRVLNKVYRLIRSSNELFVGLDIMELDVHFIEGAEGKDDSKKIIDEIFAIFFSEKTRSN
jgi:arginase family enzyme